MNKQELFGRIPRFDSLEHAMLEQNCVDGMGHQDVELQKNLTCESNQNRKTGIVFLSSHMTHEYWRLH
jgi:hypothetical protein